MVQTLQNPSSSLSKASFTNISKMERCLTCTLGVVFDVTRKADVYGPGKSYNLFAGKDASRALGMSSLKPEDAVSDYSTLGESEMKVLDDWEGFFTSVLISF
jgi:Cytochrome b5-like Heme/Steroid binding domain